MTTDELILEQFRLFRNELPTVRTEMREGFADVQARLRTLEDGVAGILDFFITRIEDAEDAEDEA